MCGIAGLACVDRHHPVERELLFRMTDSMRHRGPDAEGFHFAPGVGLGHRRLSIIDLSTGDQPIYNETGTVVVVFNGEIYNFAVLARELRAAGHHFKTVSDTEAIVHAYEEFGLDFVTRLHGMFAFALWDEPKRRLVLARDRAGKKPLYYHVDRERLSFASEIKGLLEDVSIKRQLRPEGLYDYFTFGSVPGPDTVFHGIHQVPPAHLLVWENGRATLREYWDVRFEANSRMSESEALDEFANLFDEAVRARMVAEVPLGAFLSGGIDSSAVVASMARQSGRPVVTTTVGFAESAHSEADHARLVARAIGSDHHELLVRPDAVTDLPSLVWYLDQPFADPSALPTYYVSRAARGRVTVALAGDGGDELFAGYQRRYGVNRMEDRLRRMLPGLVRHGVLGPLGRIYPQWDRLPRPLRLKLVLSNLGQTFERAYFSDMSLFRESERQSLLTPELQQAVRGHDPFAAFARHFEPVRDADPLSRILYVDFKTWLTDRVLVKVDRMSMACSLEVRAPLLDHTIVEFAARVPSHLKFNGRVSKYLLKRHVAERLPALAIHRQKQGFNLPLAEWLRKDLREVARDLLFSVRSTQRGYVRPAEVTRMWAAHQQAHRDHAPRIWALMILELWHRAYIDRS
jgi:asparagine synthase (glutamine-hydrolysing)